MPKILIIDDEKSIRNTLKEILAYEHYEVHEAPDGIEGIKIAEKEKYDLILCDIKMPKMDGMEVLEKLMEKNNDVPVVMISGHGTIDTAVEAIKKGAFDYISKPLDLNRMLVTVRNALERNSLITETKVLKRKILRTTEMVGESEGIVKVKEMIERVAPTDARVLIIGENGTGKELVARWIHEKSPRSTSPIVEVNCAAIPSELIESELFGHEKGSFTSAIKQRIGKFELANDGTLFMDEIGDMSLSAQAKVLRALQENKITRVGGEKETAVNVRLIAATNKDLKKEIGKGNFREDLYHRLSVIVIKVPALNDREDDIPLLADYFMKEICEDYNISLKEFSSDAYKELKKIRWTGNIRELRNIVERLIILCDKTITDQDVLNYAAIGKIA
ncbi:MAG: sigma-54-dependent transcriptional regulator [Bacteroidia bacterium]